MDGSLQRSRLGGLRSEGFAARADALFQHHQEGRAEKRVLVAEAAVDARRSDAGLRRDPRDRGALQPMLFQRDYGGTQEARQGLAAALLLGRQRVGLHSTIIAETLTKCECDITFTFMTASTQLIPRDVFFGNPENVEARISPDGKLLAYLAPSDGLLGVWVRTLGRADDRVVARDPARPIHVFFWQGDGSHILYLQDVAGNENHHLFAVPLGGGAARDLTAEEGTTA